VTTLHDRAIVIDGLIISHWSRSLFEDMRRGGITAANCTCSVWENFRDTMANVARWKAWLRDNADIIRPVLSAADIRRAKEEGKVGIILGWQNTSAIEDQLPAIQLFAELGVRVVQLTYNTQNLVGSGCYESRDSGLSDWGREVIDELNRNRILIDLSHVGPKTCSDAIAHSKQPVAYTHVCPRALKDHPRNKTDDQLREIAQRGGFVGVTLFTPFLPRGPESTLDDYLDIIEHTVEIVGIDRVGIGTDFSQDHPPESTPWFVRDKGYARQLTDFGEIKYPEGLQRLHQFANLTRAMERRGWSEEKILAIMGGNWLRFLEEVWGA
jgi:membrane dipeptidase